MKTVKNLQKYFGLFLLIGIHSACVNDQDFSTPTVECTEPIISATNTIQQVKEMYRFGGATVIENDVIIEGFVVSSDEAGNIYKTISIQDKPENPTSAIKIAIDQTNLYTKYNVGRKIYVKLKGLAIGFNFGSFQIGIANGRELDRIPSTEINKFIVRSCEVAEITPKIVEISDLNETMLEMLIQIENVQFKTDELGKSYGDLNNNSTVSRVLESFNNNCNLLNEISIRNSGYSKFKNELLPEGKGSVTAIFSNYYEDFQLYIRSTNDVNLTETRCDYSNVLAPTITLLEVREMYKGEMVEFGVSTNYIVEAYVISSDIAGNFKNKLVIQNTFENPSAGIQILIENETIFEDYNLGDKVFVKLNKLYMAENNGILSIGFPNKNKITEINGNVIGEYIYNSGETSTIIPTEILISETQNISFESTLVKVKNVQLIKNELGSAYTFFTGENSAIRTLETCNTTTKLGVFTNGKATFSNTLFPEDHGNIIGVLNSNLEVRFVEDVQFNEAFENCPVIIPKVMITEIADPKNSTTARFVELYNAGNTEINLTGWKLNKYTNGATTVSNSPIDLNGITIPANSFVIIANTGYAAIFNDTPTIETTYISGNGDDVYELVDNTNTIIDIFGIIGEDGTAKSWEYLDGKAIRNIAVSEPNATFTISEWTVFSAANNLLISNPNTAQNAPDDFNPKER
jgi:hypothetical protein